MKVVENNAGSIVRVVIGIAVLLLFIEGAGAASWNKVWNSSDIGYVYLIAVDDVDGDGIKI